MLPLTEEENKLRKNKIFVIQSGKKINSGIKLYQKVPDHDHYAVRYRGTAHPTCNLRYKTTNEIYVILHNRSNYDYHFIIQEIAEEFKRQIECLGGKTEKQLFQYQQKKTDGKTATYETKFINSVWFMPSSMSSLVDNLAEGLYRNKCKDCKSYLEYVKAKDKCLSGNKNYKKLKKGFENNYTFCKDYNKVCLML